MISKLEKDDIGISDTRSLFEEIFKTDVELMGNRGDRTFVFKLNRRSYNEDISYLKRRLIEKLSITD